MKKKIKPHIKYDGTRWVCHDDYYIWGHGTTPSLAYWDWKKREITRTRVPRRMIWNLQSCRQWFQEGCWTMRTYLGNRQIFGYDPFTDELILRG